MATTAISDLDAIQKVVANRPLYENVVAESEFMDLIEIESEGIQVDRTTGGRYVENSHLTALFGGYRAMSETGYLPTPRNASFINSRVYLRESHGVMEMTSRVMDLVRTDEAAFLDYLEEALPLFARKVANEDDREVIGYGYGVRARINGTPSNVSGTIYDIVVDSAFGVTGYEDAWINFMENDELVFTSSLSATIATRNPGSGQSCYVTNVTPATSTIRVDGAAAGLAAVWADNDFIASGDAVGHNLPTGASNTETQFDGFLGAIDDGTIKTSYMNVTRATNRSFNSTVIDASAAPWNGLLTEDLIDYTLDETKRIGGGMPDLFITSLSGQRSLRKYYKSDRMFIDPRSYAGGKVPVYVLIDARMVQVRASRKIPPNVFFGIERGTFIHYSPRGWEWDDRTGSIWNRVTDTTGRKSAYYCTGYKYDQWFCSHPAHSFRLDGITKVQ